MKEYVELVKKRDDLAMEVLKIESFMNTYSFKELKRIQRLLLYAQAHRMRAYLSALEARLEVMAEL